MFKNYFKIAVRNIRRNRSFSFINIVGLNIGLACCMLILLYIKNELSFDGFHQRKDSIYQLTCTRTEQDGTVKKFAIAALAQGSAFKHQIPEIQEFTRINPKDIVIKRNNDVFSDRVTWVDDSFFKIFTFPLICGNPVNALTDEHSMVLSEQAAIKYFGTTQVVGKIMQLEVNGKFEPFTVTAVAKDPPKDSSIQFNILLPFSYFELKNPDNGWMWVSFPTYFLLSPLADVKNIARKMDQVYRTQAKDEIDLNSLAGYSNHFNWSVMPLTSMHLNTEYEGTPMASNPVYSYILGGVATFILLIACVNFVNLTVAQSLKRSKEIGIRKVMGGKRSQLIIQFLGESVITCFIAAALAMLMAYLVLPLFSNIAGAQLDLLHIVDFKLIAGFIVLFLVTGFAAGLYPSLILSGFKPSHALLGKTGSGGRGYLAKVLVVVQFSLATFLITATLFMYAQFNLLTETSVGYPDKNLVDFTVENGVRSKPVMELYKAEFLKIPGVTAVSYKNIGHFGGKTQAGNKEFTATYEHIDADYLPALGANIIAGRNFSNAFPSDSTSSVLVNETLVKQAGLKDATGKTIDYMNIPGWGSKRINIIGVVKDYHSETLREKIQPMVFTQDAALPLGHMIVRVKPGHTAATLLLMEKAYHKLNPEHPFQYQFRDEENRSSYEAENKWKQVISFAAFVAIFISATGLFGLALLSAQKRAKEIGVRKVLGASVSALAGLLVKDFALLVLLAFVIAIPAGWLTMHHWLQNFASRVELSWWRFILAGFISLAIATATVGYHAVKAAMSNPVKSLENK